VTATPSRRCAGLRLGDPAGHRGGDDWFKPVDDLVEEPGGMRVALQGLTVKLEEQALVRPQCGGGEVLSPRAHELAAPLVRAMLRRGNQRALERLAEQLRACKVGDASG